MTNTQNFILKKERALNLLTLAKKNGKVDLGVKRILDIINGVPEYYTTSSCSGRVVVLSLPELGDKKNASFLNKWHEPPVTSDDLKKTLEKHTSSNMVFLQMQAPIFHVCCSSIDAADRLVKIGILAGLKNSSIKRFSSPYLVELNGTERMDVPLCGQGKAFWNVSYLEFLSGLSTRMLNRSAAVLEQLYTILTSKIEE